MTTRKIERLPIVTSDPAVPELAPGVEDAPIEIDRRELMKLLAAGASLAGLGSIAGCMERPLERIMPRVEQPPELTPGVPVEYATSMVIDGFATGLVVQTQEARPTKVEGNPEHPASLGATNPFHQASLLELYDPHRARGALEAGAPIAVETLVRMLAKRERIRGLWFLLHPQSSPLLAELIARVRARHPTVRFAYYSPLDRRHVYQAASHVFGRPLEAQYRFERAEVVVSLDGDFMAAMPNSVRWARDFATRRRLRWPLTEASRLYVTEPRPSPTGTLADHHLPARPSEIAGMAAALLAAVSKTRGAADSALSPRQRRWIDAAAHDLLVAGGRGLVVVGDRQPTEVHVVAHSINAAIGAFNSTVYFTRPAVLEPLGDGLPELAAAIRLGSVQTLVIAEANPVYTAPPDLDFAALLTRVPEALYAATDQNETSRRCRWFVPLAHFMESWGDARAYDGTISLIQPLIRPMHSGLSLAELMAVFAGELRPDGHRMLRDRYRRGSDAAELEWQPNLQSGLIPGSGFAPESVSIQSAGKTPAGAAVPTGEIEVSFDQSHAVYDGRFAGIAWLQELPKPLDKITWGNAAVMSPANAAKLGVENADVVRVTNAKWHVDLPVYILPGHADGCISVELGYGRWAGGPVADNVGSNVYRIRTAPGAGYVTGARVVTTGRRRAIANTQQHFDQHDREIALYADLAVYREHPEFTERHWGPMPTLLPDLFADTPKWGMTIDTMICTGCSSCVIACQAENNIPVVGRQGVIGNREMHWLRIDTYREHHGEDVRVIHQPMLCQHCEKAPCEYVCPTYATQHSPDGLNEMVYNRCIGTRFCSNNCPYKVRRFNWFDYTEDTPKTLQLQRNPNVTVRARGVMEKCTFCVQRIRAAEIQARIEKREIRPNEVVTACQQACPTRAIQFGQLQHEGTEVVEWRAQPRRYAVLHELGTRPRVAYLAKITNPNPLLE